MVFGDDDAPSLLGPTLWRALDWRWTPRPRGLYPLTCSCTETALPRTYQASAWRTQDVVRNRTIERTQFVLSIW